MSDTPATNPAGQDTKAAFIPAKPSLAKLYSALAKAQLDIFNPGKNRTVVVQGKEGQRSYSYDYAELNVITEIIRIPLAKNGLSFTQELGVRPYGKAEKDGIITCVAHESGEEKEFFYPLVGASYESKFKADQNFAAVVTYSKRQALKGIFGIADDTEDHDNTDPDNEVIDKKTGQVTKPAQSQAKPFTDRQSGPKVQSPQTQGPAKAPPKPPQQAPKATPPPAAQKPPEPEDIPQEAPPDEFQDQSKPEHKKGPGDYVIAYGSKKFDGKKVKEVSESDLRGIHKWIETQLKSVPPPKNLSLIFDLNTSIKLFFESMDIKL